jgi:hypothetical protein
LVIRPVGFAGGAEQELPGVVKFAEHKAAGERERFAGIGVGGELGTPDFGAAVGFAFDAGDEPAMLGKETEADTGFRAGGEGAGADGHGAEDDDAAEMMQGDAEFLDVIHGDDEVFVVAKQVGVRRGDEEGVEVGGVHDAINCRRYRSTRPGAATTPGKHQSRSEQSSQRSSLTGGGVRRSVQRRRKSSAARAVVSRKPVSKRTIKRRFEAL